MEVGKYKQKVSKKYSDMNDKKRHHEAVYKNERK